jgi:heme-degrading monooxygenase HmoA
MSSVIAYSQVVTAEVPRASWDETYFSLLSLKSHLQALPGWQRFDFWARDVEDGFLKLIVVTNWEHPEQMAQWLAQGVTADAVLRAIEPPARSLAVDLYEEIA